MPTAVPFHTPVPIVPTDVKLLFTTFVANVVPGSVLALGAGLFAQANAVPFHSKNVPALAGVATNPKLPLDSKKTSASLVPPNGPVTVVAVAADTAVVAVVADPALAANVAFEIVPVMVPLITETLPLTVSPVNVPTDVKLLLTMFKGSVVPVKELAAVGVAYSVGYKRLLYGVTPSPNLKRSVSVSKAGSPDPKIGFTAVQFADVSRLIFICVFAIVNP